MENFPVFQEQEGEWKSQKTVEILGLRFPCHFAPDPAALCNYVKNFQTRGEDVFVVSYPKSGTTWVGEILWQLYNNGEVSSVDLSERVPFLEYSTKPIVSQPELETLPSPRIIKTHLSSDVIPKGESESTRCKYVYVARNPKDVAVSKYKFVNSIPRCGYTGPWEFYAKLFIDGKVSYSRWNDHVIGWWQHKDEAKVLFLKYEDLKKDLASKIRDIARFLEINATEETICQIAEQCTFKGMQKNKESFSALAGVTDGPKLLRKGEIGDWKNYFTSDLNERFENEVMDRLTGTGLEFDFGK